MINYKQIHKLYYVIASCVLVSRLEKYFSLVGKPVCRIADHILQTCKACFSRGVGYMPPGNLNLGFSLNEVTAGLCNMYCI